MFLGILYYCAVASHSKVHVQMTDGIKIWRESFEMAVAQQVERSSSDWRIGGPPL